MKHVLGGALGLAVLVLASIVVAPREHRVVTVEGIVAESQVADLASRADVIAIVEPTSQRKEHWNSAMNRDWGDGSPEKPSAILTDTLVEVRRVLKGSLSGQTWIRGPGGTVDDVTWHFEDEVDLQQGERYLVLLKWVETPTEEGSEQSLVILGQQNGAFGASAGGWKRQSTGEVVSEDTVLP